MNRMTEFSFGIADSLLKLFFTMFPKNTTSKNNAQPEKETPPENKVQPEEKTVPDEMATLEEATVLEEVERFEKDGLSDDTAQSEKDDLLADTAHEEPVPDEMASVEEAAALAEINHSEEAASEEITQPEKETLQEELDSSEEVAVSEELQTETVSDEATHDKKEAGKRSLLKQKSFPKEYRTTEIATGLIGSMLGILMIWLAVVIGVIEVPFKFNEFVFGEVVRDVTPIFAVLAIAGVILQGWYPIIAGSFVIVAAVEGFLAMPILYLLPGVLLLISGCMGVRRGIGIKKF